MPNDLQRYEKKIIFASFWAKKIALLVIFLKSAIPILQNLKYSGLFEEVGNGVSCLLSGVANFGYPICQMLPTLGLEVGWGIEQNHDALALLMEGFGDDL